MLNPLSYDIDITAGSGNVYHGTLAPLTGEVGTQTALIAAIEEATISFGDEPEVGIELMPV